MTRKTYSCNLLALSTLVYVGMILSSVASACDEKGAQAGARLSYFDQQAGLPLQYDDTFTANIYFQIDCAVSFKASSGLMGDVYYEYNATTSEHWLNLFKLYLFKDLESVPVTFNLGYQQKPFGYMEAHRPNNLFNPTNYLDGIFTKNTIGRLSLGGEYLHDNWVLHFDLMPLKQVDNWAKDKARFRRGSFVATEEEYESDNVSWQIRWDYFGVNTEASILFWEGISPQSRVLIDEQGPLNATDYYPKIRQLGVTTQHISGAFAWKLEAAVRESEQLTSTELAAGISWYNYNVFTSRKDATLFAEIYYADEYNSDSLRVNTSFDRDVYLGVKLDFNDGKISSLNTGLLRDYEKSSWALFTNYNTNVTQSWKIRAGIEIYQPDQFDMHMVGFENDSRIYIDNTWYF